MNSYSSTLDEFKNISEVLNEIEKDLRNEKSLGFGSLSKGQDKGEILMARAANILKGDSLNKWERIAILMEDEDWRKDKEWPNNMLGKERGDGAERRAAALMGDPIEETEVLAKMDKAMVIYALTVFDKAGVPTTGAAGRLRGEAIAVLEAKLLSWGENDSLMKKKTRRL